MILFLFLFANTPFITLQDQNQETFFIPFYVEGTSSGDIFVHTQDQRVIHFNSNNQIERIFGSKGQGPGQTEMATDLLWLPETKTLWVNDLIQRRIVIFKDGVFEKAIKVEYATNTLNLYKDYVLLGPIDSNLPFIKLDFQGIELDRFERTFEFDDPLYTRSIWRMFRSTNLDHGRLVLSYVWTNKLTIINANGSTFRAMDMSNYFEQYPNPQKLPIDFAQGSPLFAGDQQVWVLTCTPDGCREFLRVDYVTGELTGRATAPYNIRQFKQLQSGKFAVIDRDEEAVKVYDSFPFAIQE